MTVVVVVSFLIIPSQFVRRSILYGGIELKSQSFSKFQALKLNDDQSVPILVNKHCSGDVKSQVFLVMKFEERFPSVMSRFKAKLKILHIQYFK